MFELNEEPSLYENTDDTKCVNMEVKFRTAPWSIGVYNVVKVTKALDGLMLYKRGDNKVVSVYVPLKDVRYIVTKRHGVKDYD